MKKVLIIFIGIMVVFTIFYALYSSGVISFETAEDMESNKSDILITIDDLENDRFYVWHDTQYSLEQDLSGTSDLVYLQFVRKEQITGIRIKVLIALSGFHPVKMKKFQLFILETS